MEFQVWGLGFRVGGLGLRLWNLRHRLFVDILGAWHPGFGRPSELVWKMMDFVQTRVSSGRELNSLLQQPGPKQFKLSKIELIYKAKKFKVPPFTI